MSKEFIDVEMPDGTVIEDVPKGTTQAEVQRRYDLMRNLRKEPNLPSYVPPIPEQKTPAPETVGERVRRMATGLLPTWRDAAMYGGMVVGGLGGTLVEPGGGTVAGGAAGALAGKDLYDYFTGSRTPGEQTNVGKFTGDISTALGGAVGMSEIPGISTDVGRELVRPVLTGEIPAEALPAGVTEEAAKEGVKKAVEPVASALRKALMLGVGVVTGGTGAEIGGRLLGSPGLFKEGAKLSGEVIVALRMMGAWDGLGQEAKTKLVEALDHGMTEEAVRLLQAHATRLSADASTRAAGQSLQQMLNMVTAPPQNRKEAMDLFARPTRPVRPWTAH